MARVFLGLGGNVGKVPEVFRQSLESLESQGYVRVIHTSSLWRSPSWGFVGPDFYNAVAEIETDAEPRELLKVLLQEEQQRGRVRGDRMGDRPVDLDILSWEGRQVDEPGLTIPHPALTGRDFVVLPLAEVDPNLRVQGATAASYRQRLSAATTCQKIDDTNDWRHW
jgi:2-amino-4-hydroxy-6-hydroxymethyldihydropteridine diphosphokinase|tara:strand:+ start:364 stop:864 length:501 start_codon:yes stop_codon:yes gene_type:complete